MSSAVSQTTHRVAATTVPRHDRPLERACFLVADGAGIGGAGEACSCTRLAPEHGTRGQPPVVAFVIAVAGAVAQIVLGFYGFWLIWRLLLPYLPGPADSHERVAPFVGFFTDPFIDPVARRLHLPVRLVTALWVVVVAAVSVVVRRLTST